MGVYIKGFKMPEGGYRTIEIAYDADGHPMAITDGGDVFDVIPVSPHGRLIDADAMLMRINHEVMEAYMDGVCYGVHPSQEYLYLLGEIIDDAPTIIPAEEGE